MRARSLSRRRFLGGAAGTAALAALTTACGEPAARTSLDAADAAPGFPVTVPGRLGPTTVDRPPSRVVAVGYLRDTDTALALGAPLVGTTTNPSFANGHAPWQQPPPDLPAMSTASGLPFERIAGLAPDLILATDDYSLARDLPRLSAIAPTLGYQNGVGQDLWSDTARRIGQVLGRTDAAEDAITRVQAQVAATRAAHPEFTGKTITLGPVQSESQIYTVNSTTDASMRLFADLGFRLSPRVLGLPSTATPGRTQVPPERLDLLDADVMVLPFTNPGVRARLEANPLFRNLPAVQRGSYVPLDLPAAVALGFPSLLSLPYGLDPTVPALAAAATR